MLSTVYNEDEEIEKLSNKVTALEGRVAFLRKRLVNLMYMFLDEKDVEKEISSILDGDDELEASM